MQYHKLIRDHIPAIIAQSGRQCQTQVLNEQEYRLALRAKLVEEAQEVQAASAEELPTELADVLEVLDALMQTYGLDETTLRQLQQQRRAERGGFTKRLNLLFVH